jgi:hypothetical protein
MQPTPQSLNGAILQWLNDSITQSLSQAGPPSLPAVCRVDNHPISPDNPAIVVIKEVYRS